MENNHFILDEKDIEHIMLYHLDAYENQNDKNETKNIRKQR